MNFFPTNVTFPMTSLFCLYHSDSAFKGVFLLHFVWAVMSSDTEAMLLTATASMPSGWERERLKNLRQVF
jgi:hypothetical protein